MTQTNTHIKKQFFHVQIFIIAIFVMSMAFGSVEAFAYKPLPVKKQKPHVWHLITIDSINLSAADFYEAWTNKDDPAKNRELSMITGSDEPPRNRALFYLMGVLDATEGKTWCGYDDSFDIKAVREKVAEHFKTIPEKILATKRASDVIETALKKNFPSCKEVRSITPPTTRGRITPDSVNLSGDDFYKVSYTNFDKNKREGALLEMYMLGVFDVTEGRLWCNYWTIHSIALREDIYAFFKKKICHDRLSKERASALIEAALRQYLPSCKRNK